MARLATLTVGAIFIAAMLLAVLLFSATPAGA